MRIRSVSVVDVARRATVGDQVVEWDGDRITSVGPDDGTPPAAGDVDGRGLFALPGLIDCHVHVTSLSADEWADSGHRASYVAAHAVRALGATVRRGFTTVRDAGGADAGLTRALDEGVLTGPRLHTCGKALSQTSGHADLRPRGRELWDPHPDVPGIGRVVDGPDAVRLAVREQVRRGATFVKLMLSGGITSPTDRLDGVQFSDAEVTAAVEEADRLGVYCAGHAYTGAAVSRAVALGVRTIEHGNLIGPADAERMAAAGAFLVPTLSAYAVLAERGEEYGLPADRLGKLAEVVDRGADAVRAAEAAGVRIALGTDLLGPMADQQNREFALRAAVQTSWEVLESATLTGAELLGEAGRLGVLAPGAAADLVLGRADPGADVRVLADPEQALALVVSRGRVVRDDR
ncbi:putative peptidase, M38 family [Modestobacter italicus]|uniref:Peptidase, M38 family n=1 Tax=Modestobacter italicus (strain DSM 44449 / CECT 9708 / BC 501) TaxID=2732864 RepID=I4F1B9_MODI5|nr:amidohydrolase family protein [Modestobacter marinus]CCH89432.1 putative peptidase, M38 family [Modestobacter marinus]